MFKIKVKNNKLIIKGIPKVTKELLKEYFQNTQYTYEKLEETIEEIEFKNGVEEITDSAFSGFKKLTSVKYPSTLKIIGCCAFYGCTKYCIVTLPEGLEEIGDRSFTYSEIKEFYIPSTVKKIYSNALISSENNFSIKVSENNPKYKDINGTILYDKETNKIVKSCNDANIPEGTIAIDYSAFEHCKIEEITCPSSLKYIEKNAFWDCKNLKSITFNEGLEEIEEGAFSHTKIKEIKLPSTLKKVETAAFAGTAIKNAIINCNMNALGAIFHHSEEDAKGSIDWLINRNRDTVEIQTKNINTQSEFYKAYKKILGEPTLEDLIEEGKSFKEINDILNKSKIKTNIER